MDKCKYQVGDIWKCSLDNEEYIYIVTEIEVLEFDGSMFAVNFKCIGDNDFKLTKFFTTSYFDNYSKLVARSEAGKILYG